MSGLKIGAEWLRGLVDFVFPPLCLGCGEYTENDYAVCDTCLESIETFSHPFCLGCMDMIAQGDKCAACGGDSLILYAYGNYATPLEQIVIQYKFKGMTRSGKMFAKLITDKFGERIKSLGCQALVPVPLHAGRENYRGYNQATILARHLSQQLDIEVRDNIIARVKRSKPQARLNHHQRAINIKGVFDIVEDSDRPAKVILVDDVVTSGATIREAARVLRKAGIVVGGAISIAHAM